jgi:hypothetical protein
VQKKEKQQEKNQAETETALTAYLCNRKKVKKCLALRTAMKTSL